jgi:tRNA(Ile)-lysidine synthase
MVRIIANAKKLNFHNFEQLILGMVNPSQVKKVAVAVSGGADSMCLALLLSRFCKLNNIDLTAVTVDHKLREESTKEAADVASCMNSFGIKHWVLTWDHNASISSNIQEKARESRYELLSKYCGEHEINHLFIAHNYDEQAETVMMNILRGSGIDGIAGIWPESIRSGIHILRPLLNFKKSEIIEFLETEGINWFEDPSNLNTKFDRIKIRQLLKKFDHNNHLIDRLNLLAQNAKRAKDFFDIYVERVFKEKCEWGEFGFISIAHSDFLALEEEIKLRLLNKIIKYIHNDQFFPPVRLDSLKLFLDTMKNHTLAKCKIIFQNEVMYFYKEPKFIEAQKELVKGCNIWDGRYEIRIDSSDFHVTRLTKEIWGEIKPKKYVHKVPGEIIFSTPVIIYPDKKQYYWPFLKAKSLEMDGKKSINFICNLHLCIIDEM